ncbi:helix-turn-helix domain-containing protein [Streptomyces sp. S.PB5]|uniref:helix-turn-helix domain-containing protein n=1 Tax=Streptomyces sp. S.PB5 TaxID=3020844 RepID=UPI0025B155A4|nr:helix-turn-helix domain-containing protein [Streptomyces sp. S.PB5]MDN3026813.1 helix-turn-helix domain-containing protein [Streptomyces sp. S.PB5]
MTADELSGTAAPGIPAPPPGLVVLGRFEEAPGYDISRPQGSASWLFTWTVRGRGRLRQGANTTRAGAGDLVVLGPGVPHAYGVEPGAGHWQFWWVHCQARPSWLPWLGPYDSGDGMYVVPAAPATPHDRVEAAFCRMLADARGPGASGSPDAGEPAPGTDDRVAVAHDSAARELALCALEEIVLLTAAGAREPAHRPGLDPRIQRVQELLAADPGAPHTVDSLAAQVALSPSRLAHLFTRQLGQSPMRALREARLRHAARLLEGTGLSVERVAVASGFVSPFHFHRVFRERFGMTPGEYRAGRPMVGT